ncbi:hypothetical protein ES703_124325 [subsurface metagenome]
MANKKILKTLFGTEQVLTVIPGAVTAVAVMLLSLVAAKYLGEFFIFRLSSIWRNHRYLLFSWPSSSECWLGTS